MGRVTQRAATVLGMLAAGILLWFALSLRTVELAEYSGRLAERRSQLQAQLRPGRQGDPERERRMAVAYAVGARLSAFEEAHGEVDSELRAALDRMHFGWSDEGTQKFVAADRELILSHVDLRLGVDELDRLEGKDRSDATRRERPLSKFMHLTDYLGLALSQSVEAGDEQGVVAGFEALGQLSCDLLVDKDPNLHVWGVLAMSSALESAWAVERIAADFKTPEEYEASKPQAIVKLLQAVPSPAGRRRLIAAIEAASRQLPSAREVLLSRFLEGGRAMSERVAREWGEKGEVPRKLVDDIRDLIHWQDRVLKTMDQPGFTATQGSVADLDAQIYDLPESALQGASPVWSSIGPILRMREELTMAKRWIAAGKVD